MNITKTLDEIIAYLRVNRGVGHTTAVLRGAQNVEKSIVVCHDERSARTLQRQTTPNTRTVSLGAVGNCCLRGHNAPLAVDNAALEQLLVAARNQIARLSDQINRTNQLVEKEVERAFDKMDIHTLAKLIVQKTEQVSKDRTSVERR